MKNKTVTFNAEVKRVPRKSVMVVDNTKPKYIIRVDEDYINDKISASIKIEGTHRFFFGCNMVGLPHCCGVFELGEIHTTDTTYFKKQTNRDICIKALFDKLFVEIFNHDEMYGKTLIINTVPISNCAELEKYLSTSKYFTKVKQWKNGGNGNLITMWVSNNF